MKIAYLSNLQLPSLVANSVHIMKMCQALVNNGHEVILIGPTKSKEKEVNVFDFYNVEKSFNIIYISQMNLRIIGQLFGSYLSVKKAVDWNPDIVYTRNETTALLASLNGLSTIYESHVPIYYSHWGAYRNIIFKQLIKRKELRLIVVISESIKKHYLKNYNLMSDDVLLARDSADPIDPGTDTISFFNQKKIQVGYVGSLNEGRGKNIIKTLAKSCDFAHFHIIGGGSDEIRSWKKDLEFENVTFYGYIPHYQTYKFLIGFDVLLAPYQKITKTEAGQNTVRWMSPLKIFEYMAAGKAIIASDLSSIREILVHGKTALLCDPEDSIDWIESLKQLKNPEIRGKLGNNARIEFMTKYTWKKRAENIIEKALE